MTGALLAVTLQLVAERINSEHDESRRQTNLLHELTELHKRDDTAFASEPVLRRLDKLEFALLRYRFAASQEGHGVQQDQAGRGDGGAGGSSHPGRAE